MKYKRPLSYSAISCFEYNPEEWYQRYIKGVHSELSKEMLFGSKIDKLIQTDKTFLPTLERYPEQQVKIDGKIGKIKIVGILDQLDLKNFRLADDKTGKNLWDKKRADASDQITMYLLLIYLKYKIPPEKFICQIRWMPTEEYRKKIRLINTLPVIIETRRKLIDILKYGSKIKEIQRRMEDYVIHRSPVALKPMKGKIVKGR